MCAPRLAWLLGLGALVSVLLGAEVGTARAQYDDVDLQLFLPTAGPGATFTIARTEVPRHLTYSLGLAGNFGSGLLVREADDADIVPWRTQVELLGALGLFEWLELGFAMPLVISKVADDPFAAPVTTSTEVAPGDLRVEAKVPILRGDFALSGRFLVALPTGRGRALAGTDYWSATPSLLLSYERGIVRLASELGYLFRREANLGGLQLDDELQLGFGGTVRLVERFWVVAETRARVGVGGDYFASNENPWEVDVGVRWASKNGLLLDTGVGTSILSGYGSPTVRAFAIVRYGNEREPCEGGPEDFDGYEDGDFCADPDNDADGIPDEGDLCPNDAEDVDGFLDDDGCPDVDNDADAVRDAEDACPTVSEDRDGYQDDDGCPERDNDEDGVVDGHDQCPMEPEDRDGYQDTDGCPEPGPARAVVTVTDTRILVSERIYFDFDTDVIRDVSLPLLDQVADVVKQLPAGRRVRVEGYSDSAGDPEYNLDLSYRRARSVVEYLRARGVPRDRLEYVGYGVQNPVAPNDMAEGRALNRRVEFTILNEGEGEPPPTRRGRRASRRSRRSD